jgi:hypothetical protein
VNLEGTLAAALEDLYAGALDDVAWSRAITSLITSGATEAHLVSFSPLSGNVLRDEAHRLDPLLTAAYRTYQNAKDILVPPFLTTLVGEPTPDYELVPCESGNAASFSTIWRFLSTPLTCSLH